MIIKVKVIPGTRQEKIKKIGDTFKIWLNAPAQKGKANKALLKKLADYFNVSCNQIEIVAGHFSREKLIKINLTNLS